VEKRKDSGTSPRPSGLAERLDRFFEVSARGSSFEAEVRGGLATFMTMSYIIFVNPAILSAAGAPFAATLTATVLSAALLTVLMGVWARNPFALAPGMGINAFVAFGLVKAMGLPWQTAMGVIFWEGLTITLLVALGLRERIMDVIPMELKHAISVGIGAFIAFIGFVEAGLVKPGSGTPVTLGRLSSPEAIVALAGLAAIAVLWHRRVRGAVLLGILFSTAIAVAWKAMDPRVFPTIRLTALSSPLSLPDVSTIGRADVLGAARPELVAVIIAVMLSDFFDTMGTVVGIGEQAGLLDERGRIPRLYETLMVDSLGAMLGGLFCSSSNTVYIESAAGVAEGARTGLASVVTGLLFLAFLFTAPLASLIPSAATAPALIFVGYLMMQNVSKIGFEKVDVATGLAAFATILYMPYTYSIANGIALGFIVYTLAKILQGDARRLSPAIAAISLVFAWYLAFAAI